MPGLPRGPKSRVLTLEVENFKSYRGRQEIGPFQPFTAVIGPNGSGKSNLMDAISFVLGVKGAQLRGSLKELLYSYSESNEEESRPQQGYVKLVMEVEAQGTISFKRSIMPNRSSDGFTSTYAVDDQTVTWTKYEEKLKSFGILVKARNFLVFQGDIEHVAGLQPSQITTLFESISGSETFKADYEKLEVAKKEAEEKLQFVLAKKKNTHAEKRQKKAQKEEAEKHIAKQQELEKLKVTYFLWQLYHAQKDAARAETELAEQKERLIEAAKELQATEGSLEVKKRGLATLNKKKVLLDKKIRSRRNEVENKNPEHVKAKMELERTAKKIQSQENELKALQEKEKERESKCQRLRKQLQDLRAAEQDRVAAASASGRKTLDETIMNDYQRTQEEARARTSKAATDLESLRVAQRADWDALADQQGTLQTVIDRLEQLESARLLAGQQQTQLVDDLKAAQQELQAKREELTQQVNENRKNNARRAQNEEKQKKLDGELRQSKASRKDRDREQRQRETISEMKRLFSGVYGRVPDLGKVTQQSYNLAMAVIMGPNMDSVVVEDEAVAKDCIAYLKAKRVQPMTFIPLQTVKAKQPNERLRTLGGSAKLAVDLLEYEPRLERAFHFVCGNTLVCEDDGEAKHLAFGRGAERHKVVTKAGLLIAKSGAMTGGGTSSLESRAARFDDAHNQALRQELEQVNRWLDTTPSEQEARRRVQRMETAIQGLQDTIAVLEKEITADRGRTSTAQHEIETLAQKKAELEPKVEGLQKAIDARQAKIDSTQDRINQVFDRLYASLSKKAGVANIREHLAANNAEVERQENERISNTRQIARVKQQLQYEEKTTKADLGKMQASLQRLKDRLAELQESEERHKAAAAAVEEEVAVQLEELRSLQQSIKEAEAELKELKQAEAKQTEAGSKLRRGVREREASLEALAAKQADILHVASLEQVPLPREEPEDESEAMDTGDEDAEAADRAAQGQLKFSGLKREHKGTTAVADRERLDAEFRADIEARAAILAKAAPNLKAVSQFNEAKEKDDREKTELDKAREEEQLAREEFLEVQTQRREAFMAAYNHIKDGINSIYKDLTKSRSHPAGGTAYLSLESTENIDSTPFSTGISFTAMPPSKRWRQMEALSGGEKTVAALALLFAIHSYHPSPFFVLDEIDAALDASNVAKVANYIREKTRTQRKEAAEFQAVVISLKDYFFSKADGLVGVTRDPQFGCSATFTMDLNQFGEPEY